mmetsp:Transcript_127239/g.407227  ORF Transcript_127239/g.407227 Transcript_127239/m.407227 type:complete len:276 (-) Transcript_127239:1835-2662(-)
MQRQLAHKKPRCAPGQSCRQNQLVGQAAVHSCASVQLLLDASPGLAGTRRSQHSHPSEAAPVPEAAAVGQILGLAAAIEVGTAASLENDVDPVLELAFGPRLEAKLSLGVQSQGRNHAAHGLDRRCLLDTQGVRRVEDRTHTCGATPAGKVDWLQAPAQSRDLELHPAAASREEAAGMGVNSKISTHELQRGSQHPGHEVEGRAVGHIGAPAQRARASLASEQHRHQRCLHHEGDGPRRARVGAEGASSEPARSKGDLVRPHAVPRQLAPGHVAD